MPVGTAPYIPNRDGDLALWSDNFSTLITASPGTYGLVAGDAVSIATVNSTFQSALTAATGMGTRGPATVAAKNVAKVNLLATVRPYAQLISRNSGVAVEDKVAVGVNPRTAVPSPIPEPTQSPILAIIAATPLQHTLRFSPQDSPDSRGKPFGAIQMQVYAKASATPIVDQGALTFYGLATKNPYPINWDVADVGKQGYVAARFVTRTGKVGPWSTIASFTVSN